MSPSVAVASQSVGSIQLPAIMQHLLVPGASFDSKTRAFFEPRFGYDFSEVRPAKMANQELSGTVRASHSRDYPNALDRSNQDMKNAYPNSTSVGPFNLPWKWRFK
jgi:hypothetical protein